MKADVQADRGTPLQKAEAKTDLLGNGDRSGAMAPEPKSSAEVLLSPPVKTMTPKFDWPKPSSAGVRKSTSPKLQSPQPLPPITSPKPPTPAQEQAPNAEIKWPSPRAEDQQPC